MDVHLRPVEMFQVAEILAIAMTTQEITRAILILGNVTHIVAVHSTSQGMQATIHAVALPGAVIS
jgi:hypothetical protein